IGSRGRVEDDIAGGEIDQLVARSKRPPLAGDGAVAADAEAGDIVVKLDVEPELRGGRPALAQPVDQFVAHQPADLTLDRADLHPRESRGPRPGGAPAVQRMKPAGGERQCHQRCKTADHATIFTSRSGTTITLRGGAPASCRCTLSDARASASASSF